MYSGKNSCSEPPPPAPHLNTSSFWIKIGRIYRIMISSHGDPLIHFLNDELKNSVIFFYLTNWHRQGRQLNTAVTFNEFLATYSPYLFWLANIVKGIGLPDEY